MHVSFYFKHMYVLVLVLVVAVLIKIKNHVNLYYHFMLNIYGVYDVFTYN